MPSHIPRSSLAVSRASLGGWCAVLLQLRTRRTWSASGLPYLVPSWPCPSASHILLLPLALRSVALGVVPFPPYPSSCARLEYTSRDPIFQPKATAQTIINRLRKISGTTAHGVSSTLHNFQTQGAMVRHTPHKRPNRINQIDHLGLHARVVLRGAAAERWLGLRGAPSDYMSQR